MYGWHLSKYLAVQYTALLIWKEIQETCQPIELCGTIQICGSIGVVGAAAAAVAGTTEKQ